MWLRPSLCGSGAACGGSSHRRCLCLRADRQVSERTALDARKREQFQRLKEQFVKDQEVGWCRPWGRGRRQGWEGAGSTEEEEEEAPLRCVVQRRRAARQEEPDDDFSYAREHRDRERRLKALEEQLERRAR